MVLGEMLGHQSAVVFGSPVYFLAIALYDESEAERWKSFLFPSHRACSNTSLGSRVTHAKRSTRLLATAPPPVGLALGLSLLVVFAASPPPTPGAPTRPRPSARRRPGPRRGPTSRLGD